MTTKCEHMIDMDQNNGLGLQELYVANAVLKQVPLQHIHENDFKYGKVQAYTIMINAFRLGKIWFSTAQYQH